jgi:hypothetical protein
VVLTFLRTIGSVPRQAFKESIQFLGENISNVVITHLNSQIAKKQKKRTGNLLSSEPVLIMDERNENLRFSIQLLNSKVQKLYTSVG